MQFNAEFPRQVMNFPIEFAFDNGDRTWPKRHAFIELLFIFKFLFGGMHAGLNIWNHRSDRVRKRMPSLSLPESLFHKTRKQD